MNGEPVEKYSAELEYLTETGPKTYRAAGSSDCHLGTVKK